jgi:hypothetical protein
MNQVDITVAHTPWQQKKQFLNRAPHPLSKGQMDTFEPR